MRHTLDFLKQLAHGLAIQFGSSCEIAGDGPSGIVLETLESDP